MAVTKAARPDVQRQAQAAKRPVKNARPKSGEVVPVFETMFQPDGDQLLDGYPATSAQDDVDYEISEALKRIKAEKQARREQYRVLTDPNFYLVVCFQSTVQRDEFIEKAGWQDLGYPYLDGLKLARLLGVDVEPIHLPRKQTRQAPKALRGHLEPRKE